MTIRESISYLIAQIGKAHRSRAEAHLSCSGVHVGQEMLLMLLWEQDGQTQSQLAEKMDVQLPTLSKMLRRMESNGLVEKREDAADSRVSRVFLTAASRQLQQELTQVWQLLEEQTLANLTTDERILLRRLLLQVHTNLTEGT